MSWKVDGNKLQMTVGDFGVKLPVTISDITISQSDSFRFKFVDAANKNQILVKDFSSFQDNRLYLEFTAEERSLFVVGYYLYSLDWFENGNFMCNLIDEGSFKVVKKV